MEPKPRARQLQNGWWVCGQYTARGFFYYVPGTTLSEALFEWRIQAQRLKSLGMYWELFP